MTEYLTCADTAKLIRKTLKKQFPGVKFSVRSKTYSGGASIRINWTDGPAQKTVERIARQFEGAGFDGMIDYKYHQRHWLMPDGSVKLAYREDTADCAGTVPGETNAKPHPDAKEVSFGADFIFCDRDVSDEWVAKCEQAWQRLESSERTKLINDPKFPMYWDTNPDYWTKGACLAVYLSEPQHA